MAKTRSKTQGLHYAAYKNQGKQAANRKRKLSALLKKFPNNLQIAEALKNIKYRRGTPKSPHWSHSAINAAVLAKSFTKGPIPKILVDKHMFSLKSRAHCKGVPLWMS